MATTAESLDSLDEFFDFAQLEHDNRLHAVIQPQQWPLQSVPLDEDDSAMDWQHSAPEDPTASTVTLRCHSVYGDDDLLSVSNNSHPAHSQHNQWPLPANGIDYHPPWLLPSSSFVLDDKVHQSDAKSPITMDVMKSQVALPELQPHSKCQPHIPTPIDTIPEESHPPHPTQDTRPPLPSRQASILSHKPASAKHKGPQSRIPLEARQILEDEFAANPYPCSWELDIIAHQANLDVKKVRNWFNNTRARKKNSDPHASVKEEPTLRRNGSSRSLNSKLSRDSLEALDKHADEDVHPPQPPLAFYLAQSYQEEAVDFSAVQAAIDSGSLKGSGDFQTDTSSSFSKMRSPGSVITSVHSSEGTAPTTYTVSSSGSNISSFGRDRRRGRRRMAWKQSPYTRPKFNGLNSAGEPQEDLPFFCTFCPRAFKTKYEWVRHEDSVHALRTTWICCDTKNVPLQSCPFCGQMYPDEVHMATHKYQQCRNKPESQRTFYRRDHFIQHLHHVHFSNVKHPSVRLGCQARLMASEGHNFGCKDLAMKWRRFGAPMKRDDPMLHCGFCGKRSKDWPDRCEHVAEHLIARSHDRSAWWPERLENHMENLCFATDPGPFRCRYCRKVFSDHAAMNKHSHCRVWSCRFLQTFDDVAMENSGPPLCPQFPSPRAHHCHLCGAGYRSFHVEHAQHYHRYRNCTQELYTSEEDFLQHLHDFHGASHPSLLQSSSVIEQSFSRNKGASFETVGMHKTLHTISMDVDMVSPGPSPTVQAQEPPVRATAANQTQPHTSNQTSPSRKKSQEGAHVTPQSHSTKPQRKRTNTNASNPEPPPKGPRFFRLRSHALAHSFFTSRIFYTRHGHTKQPAVKCEEGTVLEEMPMGHVAALAMSAGLVGMAGVRWAVAVKGSAKGVVELGVEEEEDE